MSATLLKKIAAVVGTVATVAGLPVVIALWIQGGVKDGEIREAKVQAAEAKAQMEAASREAAAAKAALLIIQQAEPESAIAKQATAILDLRFSTPAATRGPDGIIDLAQAEVLIAFQNVSLINLRGVSFQVLSERDIAAGIFGWRVPSGDADLPMRQGIQLSSIGVTDYPVIDLAPGQPSVIHLPIKTVDREGREIPHTPGRVARLRVIAYALGFLQKDYEVKVRFR